MSHSDERAESVELQGAFADRDDWSSKGWCRVERALDVVGTRSSMLLVRELFYGAHKFDELVRRAQLSEAVAASRLKQLVADGVVDRRPYREPGRRTRDEYFLTDRGRRLFPVIVGLMEWGDTLRDDRRTAVELIHRDCGSPLVATVRCTAGHDVPLDEAGARMRDEKWVLAQRGEA